MIVSLIVLILLIAFKLANKCTRYAITGLIFQIIIINIAKSGDNLALVIFLLSFMTLALLKRRLIIGNKEGNREY